MALGQGLRETEHDIRRRFGIAQDRPAEPEQLGVQRGLRELYSELAVAINGEILDSREKSLALTALEESLMWTGKAIFS